MLIRLPLKFLSILISAQILRMISLTLSKWKPFFLVILLMRAMGKDAKGAHITADRSRKAGYTSQSPILSYMNRACNTCAVFVVKKNI